MSSINSEGRCMPERWKEGKKKGEEIEENRPWGLLLLHG
jgi:hypothetical protein